MCFAQSSDRQSRSHPLPTYVASVSVIPKCFVLRLFGLTNYPVDHSLMMEMEMESHGTYRDHWCYSWEKLHFSRVILVLGVLRIFSVSFNGRKKLELRVSSLCQDHDNLLLKKKNILNYACRPCAGAMQLLLKKKNFTDSSALCRDHTDLHCFLSVEEKLDCTDAGLLRDIRTFRRAVEGASVSPLTNAMGGVSG